jgi:heparosan-N-sulfate-glucuronate 5-epimerase
LSSDRRFSQSRLGRFLSVSFNQPPGQRIATDGVRGYYLDMRVKAKSPAWPSQDLPPLDRALRVVIAQWGLAAYEHWLETGDERWLAGARAACDHFVATQLREGPLAGGWPHKHSFPHSFELPAGWLSGMAQGEAASLLVRVHAETGDDALAEAALRGLRPLGVASADGGVLAELEGGPWFEEYPTKPASLVLNGGIFAIWGVRDVAVALGDADSERLFGAALDALAAGIGRWDLGYWSRYDLYPHKRVNVASNAYHQLHIDQLAALNTVAPRPALVEAEERFRRYHRSRLGGARAFAGKVAFRLAVPREKMD